MNLRVLVFEDDQAIRGLLGLLIEKLGHEALAWSDPTEAPLPCFQTGKCSCPPGMMCADMVITDHRMPKMYGLRFLERQKAIGCKAIRNSVLVSGTLRRPEMEEALALGCKVLTKPFRPREITSLIDEVESTTPDRRRLWDFPGLSTVCH